LKRRWAVAEHAPATALGSADKWAAVAAVADEWKSTPLERWWAVEGIWNGGGQWQGVPV
jgi:hypothetical protein